MMEEYKQEIEDQRERINAIEKLYDRLKRQHKEARQKYRDNIIDAVEELRQQIDEPFPLLEVEERGRMSFDYQEVLTSDGVRIDGRGYYDWDGAIPVEDYVEKQYRGTEEHLDLLAERLTNTEDELPVITYPVHS